MPAQVTRVELVVIIAALLVLLFCNQPPKSGNADVRVDSGQAMDAQSSVQVQADLLPPPDGSEFVTASMTDPGAEPPSGPVSDNVPVEPIPQAPPQPQRYGMVDARRSGSLKYSEIMYGEIKVRWVWDGTRFVARKVCEVKEMDGAVSIWSFDDKHEGIVVCELPPDQLPPDLRPRN